MDPLAFLASIDEALTLQPKVFDPISGDVQPWIKTDILKASAECAAESADAHYACAPAAEVWLSDRRLHGRVRPLDEREGSKKRRRMEPNPRPREFEARRFPSYSTRGTLLKIAVVACAVCKLKC